MASTSIATVARPPSPSIHPYQEAAIHAVPPFRGSARDEWVSGRIEPTGLGWLSKGEHHIHSLKCGHTPVKILSKDGTTSLGFIMSRARCCAESGNLLCAAHAGNRTSATGLHPYTDVPTMEYSTVSHGDHIDFVVGGRLTHPGTDRDEKGELLWEECGELVELDRETIADMYDILG